MTVSLGLEIHEKTGKPDEHRSQQVRGAEVRKRSRWPRLVW